VQSKVAEVQAQVHSLEATKYEAQLAKIAELERRVADAGQAAGGEK
jgi:hypothetical protein